MTRRLARITRTCAMTMVLGVVACNQSEGPVAPHMGSTPTLGVPVKAGRSMGYANGNYKTIVDEDGTTYELNIVAREIVSSNGQVAVLSFDETQRAATAFQSVIEGDQLTSSLPAPTGPRLDEPYSINPDPVEQLESSARPVARRPVGGMENGIMDTWPPSCNAISTAVYNANSDWKKSNNLLFGTLRNILGSVVAVDASGRPTVEVPNAFELAQAFDDAAMAAMSSWTQLNLYATMYKNYGCWSTSWVSGGYLAGPDGSLGGSSAGDLVLNCTYETGYVLMSDGEWRAVEVRTCEYQ